MLASGWEIAANNTSCRRRDREGPDQAGRALRIDDLRRQVSGSPRCGAAGSRYRSRASVSLGFIHAGSPPAGIYSNTTPAGRNHPRRFRPQRQTRALMMAEQRVTTARRAQLVGSTTCCRPARAIYVVQTARRVDPGPITVGKSGEYRRKRCISILCKPVNRSRGNGEETVSYRHWRWPRPYSCSWGCNQTVNETTAFGGSLDGPGPVVVDGMLYVTSGYAHLGGAPGNVLLAFSVAGK